ncbi:MAG: hypothetical protein Q8Q18_00435 [bacterium]|nr:hypothetical protein [bacterium]
MKCSSRGEITAIAGAYLVTKGRHPMAKSSHPNPTPSGVLGTVAKLIRLTEKEDVEWSHWQHPTNNVTARRNLAEYLKKGCPKVGDNGEVVTNQLPEGHELARLILGDDYITPEEVATAYGVSYTDEELEHFADSLPDTQTILWLRVNEYMLIAGIPVGMHLLQIRGLASELVYTQEKGWFSEDHQDFAKNYKVSTGEWLAIRKGEVPNSSCKKLDLLSKVEHVPNAGEVKFAVTSYLGVRGIYLSSIAHY